MYRDLEFTRVRATALSPWCPSEEIPDPARDHSHLLFFTLCSWETLSWPVLSDQLTTTVTFITCFRVLRKPPIVLYVHFRDFW